MLKKLIGVVIDSLGRRPRQSPAPPTYRKFPPADGRRFVWINAKPYAKAGGQPELVPVIIYDAMIGGSQRLAIVADRVLEPDEYFDDLETLAARYPAPPTPED